MRQKAFIEGFSWVDCPSPVTSPKYLGKELKALAKHFDEISPNFIDWFGEQFEQLPFHERFRLGYGNTIDLLSYKSAESKIARMSNEELGLMQILIGAPALVKKLTPMHTILAFPAESYKGRKCQVVLNCEHGRRRLLLDQFSPDGNLPPESGLLFGSSTSVLPEGSSIMSVDNRVPFLKSEGLG